MTLREEKQKVSGLEEFFGKPQRQINPLLFRIAYERETPPEWLRGCHSLSQLSRYTTHPLAFTILREDWKPTDLSDHIEWIVETLTHRWSMSAKGFHFEDIAEATFFKLRWY